MEQIDLLIDKGISVIELTNKWQELRKQWGEAFTKDLTKNQKRQIDYFFLGHISRLMKRMRDHIFIIQF